MPDNQPVLRDSNYARANWSRWIVDCSTPYCRGAMAVMPGSPDAWCKDCGQTTERIVWPADVEGVEAILSMRPDWTTRNWDHTQTLDQLMLENIEHGDLPPGLDIAGPSRQVMATVGDRIVGGLVLDMLPSAEQRKSIGA